MVLPNSVLKWLNYFTFHQWCMKTLVVPLPYQHLKFPGFLTTVILVVSSANLTVVFVCVSLMINDAEHVSMYFLAICMYSLIWNDWLECWQNLFGFLIFLLLWELFVCSGFASFVKCMCCKYFLPMCGLAFNFLKCLLLGRSY